MAEGVGAARVPSSRRFFGDSRSRSVWQWQLLLAFTTVMIAAFAAFLTPSMFEDWRFGAGLAMIVVLTALALAVPWHRVAARGVLAIPILDAVAIGLLDAGTGTSLSVLWMFPMAWVATYYSTSVTVAMLGAIGALTLWQLFVNGISEELTLNALIMMATLGFVGVIMLVGAERSRASNRLAHAQSRRVEHALRRVTDQKARTQRLIDSLEIGVARVGHTGVIEFSNAAFRSLYGLAESARLRPTSAVEYLSRRGAPVASSETMIARAARGELFADELVWVFGLDGEWRALKASTRVIGESAAADDGLVLLVDEVTAAIDPRASQHETRRSISHELRNPLTAMLGHVELLLERTDTSDAARRQLQVVERAGNRMERLIDEALDAQKYVDDDIEFDLAEVARASVEAFAPVAEAEGVTLRAQLDEPLPLRADAFRLRQVVDNLLGNAIKYAQHAGAVAVRSERIDGELRVVITDTGIGISEADLPRIFEPDFRTELARERGIPGTGLGLGISNDIVLDQGGRLEITSTLGEGTQAVLVLPAQHDRSAA